MHISCCVCSCAWYDARMVGSEPERRISSDIPSLCVFALCVPYVSYVYAFGYVLSREYMGMFN